MALLCLTSCVDTKLRHLGYTYFGSNDPKVDYSGWGRDHSSYHRYAYEGVDLGPSFPKFVYNSHPSKSNNYNVGDINMLLRYKHSYFREHSHQMLRDYQYAIFCPEGYVSEMDISELRETLHYVTARTLLRMFVPMVEGEFIHDTYSKNFTRILSDAIKDRVMAVKIKDNFSDPGGWQLFKPIEGLDKQEEPHNPNKYLIGDMGDGWYKIFSPFSRDTISVKVAFAGKYLNSIIVGLKNEKKGVDILETNYNTRYNNQMLTFTPMDDLVYTYMVMSIQGDRPQKTHHRRRFLQGHRKNYRTGESLCSRVLRRHSEFGHRHQKDSEKVPLSACQGICGKKRRENQS